VAGRAVAIEIGGAAEQVPAGAGREPLPDVAAAGLTPGTRTGRSRGPIRATGHANASTASTPISGSTTDTPISRRHRKNLASAFRIPGPPDQ
jgi:hypothetical protein